MKTLPVAMGLGSSVFLAGLLLQPLGITNHKIIQLNKINATAIRKVGSNDTDVMRLAQRDIKKTSYLLTAKRLVIFKKILPKHQRIMVFYSNSGDESTVVHVREAAERLGVGLVERPVRTLGELKVALSRIKREEVDGIFYIPDPLITAHVDLLLEQAKKHRIPTMTYDESFIAKGALMSYGISPQNSFPQERPRGMARSGVTEEMPLRKRTPRYKLVLNLDIADQIDFRFPQIALNRADRIVADEAD